MSTISIVIPCYNEADGIPNLKKQLVPAVEALSANHQLELVLVDDGSTDNTFDLLHAEFAGWENCKIVRHERNLNLGAAIRTGVANSTGELVGFLDSDCTYEPSVLIDLVNEVVMGAADLVTASPYHPAGRVLGVPSYRLWLSKSLTSMYRLILRRRIFTFTAMVRVFRRDVYGVIASQACDFTSVAEMMLRALKADLRVSEVPATLSVRQFGQSKMKVLRVIGAHMRLIGRLLFQPNSFV